MRASPVGQRTPGRTCGSLRHSSSRPGPAPRWIAPSTPPPPSSVSLAALTMASTARMVMSPSNTCMVIANLQFVRHPREGGDPATWSSAPPFAATTLGPRLRGNDGVRIDGGLLQPRQPLVVRALVDALEQERAQV